MTRKDLISAFGAPSAEKENRMKWQIGEFTFCVGFAIGNPIALFNILDQKGRSCGGGSGDLDFITESFEQTKQKSTLFFFMTERQQGGANAQGRWHTYIEKKYFSCSSEEGREKAIEARPKRCIYTGHTIYHRKLTREEIPKDAKVTDLTSLYG